MQQFSSPKVRLQSQVLSHWNFPYFQQLVNAPAWQFMTIPINNGAEKLLLRGDCEGQVSVICLLFMMLSLIFFFIFGQVKPG